MRYRAIICFIFPRWSFRVTPEGELKTNEQYLYYIILFHAITAMCSDSNIEQKYIIILNSINKIYNIRCQHYIVCVSNFLRTYTAVVVFWPRRRRTSSGQLPSKISIFLTFDQTWPVYMYISILYNTTTIRNFVLPCDTLILLSCVFLVWIYVPIGVMQYNSKFETDSK